MSTHRVDVIRIREIQKHPNADQLEIIPVGLYTCVVRKGEWNVGDLAAYIEPDYVVPDVPTFAFLQGKRRIGAKRLRGVWSEGLLVKAPEGAAEGDDALSALGVQRYVPPADERPSWFGVAGPPLGAIMSVPPVLGSAGKYDLENLLKFADCFAPGEPVRATEKLHGTNARYVYLQVDSVVGGGEPGDTFYCGSRTQWRKPEPSNVYWNAAAQNRWVEGWCRAHPNKVLYGEIFGDVQDLKYGAEKGQYNFRAFDVWDLEKERWLFEPWNSWPQLQWAPEVYEGPFDLDKLRELAEKDSVFGGIREGLVVEPVGEQRFDPRIGRIKMKLVSRRYLGRP